MFLFGKSKSGKRKSKAVKKRQPTREERIRSIKNRKIFAAVSIALIVIGGTYYSHRIGAVVRFKEYSVKEFMKISSNSGFKVDEILISGRSEIDKRTLISALTIKRNMPIFGLDVQGAKQGLEELSWVKEVTISRVLPNIVFVDLKERVPVALWQKDGKVSLVDEEGTVLETKDFEKWKNLPIVVGKGAIESLPEIVFLLNIEPIIKERIVSATRIGERRWDFVLDNGILIKLPEEDVEFALRRLVDLEQEKNIFSKNVKVFDLRKPERMVVELAKPQ